MRIGNSAGVFPASYNTQTEDIGIAPGSYSFPNVPGQMVNQSGAPGIIVWANVKVDVSQAGDVTVSWSTIFGESSVKLDRVQNGEASGRSTVGNKFVGAWFDMNTKKLLINERTVDDVYTEGTLAVQVKLP